jgi:hypothetical protein
MHLRLGPISSETTTIVVSLSYAVNVAGSRP